MDTIKKKPQVNMLKPIGALLRRFHMIIFFVVIIGVVAASVILINSALTDVETDGYVSPISAGSIDQAGLDKIKSLHTSAEPVTDPVLPAGRISPFGE
jgi:hypothetical protein